MAWLDNSRILAVFAVVFFHVSEGFYLVFNLDPSPGGSGMCITPWSGGAFRSS